MVFEEPKVPIPILEPNPSDFYLDHQGFGGPSQGFGGPNQGFGGPADSQGPQGGPDVCMLANYAKLSEKNSNFPEIVSLMNEMNEGPPEQPQYGSMEYNSPNNGFFSLRIAPKYLPGTSMSGSGLKIQFHYFKKSSCHTGLNVLLY